jgi:hypothetical protein
VTTPKGVLGSFPGRTTVRVPVPSHFLDEAERIAEEFGVDPAVVLGDLVAQQLPEALAESAREVLRLQSRSDTETPPTPAEGVSGPTSPQDQAALSLPGEGSELDPVDDNRC